MVGRCDLPGEGFASYAWDFGDGNIGSGVTFALGDEDLAGRLLVPRLDSALCVRQCVRHAIDITRVPA
jgi:hypothetical protein